MGFYENLKSLPLELQYVSLEALDRWGFDGWLNALPILIDKFYNACPQCLTELDFTPFRLHENDSDMYVCDNGHCGSIHERCSVHFFVSNLLKPIARLIVKERCVYRERKDFKEADRLRVELYKLGFDVEDDRDGSTLIEYANPSTHKRARWIDNGMVGQKQI